MAPQRKATSKAGASGSAPRVGRDPSATGFRRADVVELDTYLVRDKLPAPPANAGSGNVA